MRRTFMIWSLVALFLSSCSKEGKQDAQKQNKPQPFEYIVAQSGAAENQTEYPARLEGMENVEIRPKVDGFVEGVFVDEGQVVSKGQKLFSIRNPQYEQMVRVANASVNSAQAAVATAQMQVTKTKPLVDRKIISAYELQAAQLNLKAAQADLAQQQAQLTNAKVNQGYTLITSPVSGVVGSLPLKTGSYVSASTSQSLTTVSNISKIFAYFSINEKAQLNFLKHSEGASVQEKIKNTPLMTLKLSDGTIYNEKGKLESISGLVDPNTGSFTMRATFPNAQGLLRSGYSATIVLPNNLEDVIVIPQDATFELQGKTFVYIVEGNNKVKSKEVSITSLPGGITYAVNEGLKKGDKVIVQGIGLLKDDAEIVPKETSLQAVLNKEK